MSIESTRTKKIKVLKDLNDTSVQTGYRHLGPHGPRGDAARRVRASMLTGDGDIFNLANRLIMSMALQVLTDLQRLPPKIKKKEGAGQFPKKLPAPPTNITINPHKRN